MLQGRKGRNLQAVDHEHRLSSGLQFILMIYKTIDDDMCVTPDAPEKASSVTTPRKPAKVMEAAKYCARSLQIFGYIVSQEDYMRKRRPYNQAVSGSTLTTRNR